MDKNAVRIIWGVQVHISKSPSVCGSQEDLDSVQPISNSQCELSCIEAPLEFCGGTGGIAIYQFQNATGALNALSAVNGPLNTLKTLIQSVTAENNATVGPVSLKIFSLTLAHGLMFQTISSSIQSVLGVINEAADVSQSSSSFDVSSFLIR